MLALLLSAWTLLHTRAPTGATLVQVENPAASDASAQDDAVDVEIAGLQALLAAMEDGDTTLTDDNALDEDTLARELLALQEIHL